MEGHEFLTAHFCNNERTTIEVYWATEDKTRVTHVEAKDGDPQYEEVLKHVSIDQLHENTYKHIREQNDLFEEQVIEIAKKRGMIYDVDEVNTEIYKVIGSAIFASFDPEKDKEKLFMFKLQLFEIDQIKTSKNRDLKAKLRKSKSIVEATKIAIEIVEDISGTTE